MNPFLQYEVSEKPVNPWASAIKLFEAGNAAAAPAQHERVKSSLPVKASAPMSTQNMVLIGVGVLAVGAAAFLLLKKK